METFFAFLPLIIIFAALAWLARWQMRTYSTHIAHVNTINQEILNSNREMIAELKTLNQTLKDRG
ncbi:hypothetical protein [Ahrensia sp. R2A130]|uniref:hypothetical protein n=1 Tax=Ahrensia sp. R2A130 TaxID=744979 RepID=UPI0001E08430|nr:hypothetical protein [Ahrensia sp. R2A130]EFL88075.1 lysine aminomutase [Ahrensia sp. R2A130]